MHAILGDPYRRRIFVVIWPLVGAGFGVLPLWWAGGALRDWWAVALWGEALALPMLAATYVTRSAPLSTAGLGRVFLTIGAGAVVTAGIWLEAGRWWVAAVAWIAPSPAAVFGRMAAPAALAAALVFVVMSAVHYAIAAGDERRTAVARALEAEISAREAELRALRAQLDPHFLFNCLHSISALVGSDPAAARRMCIDLAGFFRESLRAGARPRIALAAEVALMRRYLDIERLRFGDRLATVISVEPEAERALVPPLLLQPLAENAVRHGVNTMLDATEISVVATRRGDRIEILMENPFDPEGRHAGTGVGLANVRARLDATYPGRAALRVVAADRRFRVSLSLPAEEDS